MRNRRADSSIPNQAMTSGMRAMGGTAEQSATSGRSASQTSALRAASRPTAIPIVEPTAKPRKMRRRLMAMWMKSSPLHSMAQAVPATTEGGGTRVEFSTVRLRISQAASGKTTAPSGRSRRIHGRAPPRLRAASII